MRFVNSLRHVYRTVAKKTAEISNSDDKVDIIGGALFPWHLDLDFGNGVVW